MNEAEESTRGGRREAGVGADLSARSSGIDPRNPTDSSPLQISRDTELDDAPFAVRSGARLRCGTCGAISRADDQRADHIARTEGVSDPADMTILIPVTCPACGARGILTLGYGPDSDPDAADFVAAVPRNARG
jgi:hypothetical protein